MKATPFLFRLTGIVVFLQLFLGGLLTFDFVSATPHIVAGLALFIVAIATMIATFVSKASFRPIRVISVVMVVLILLQILLGFATLGSGSSVVALLHFVNAMAIYGVSISGTFMAVRWDRLAKRTAAKEGGDGTSGRASA